MQRSTPLYDSILKLLRHGAIDGTYTSLGHVCGFYGNAILFESKARKQAHSKLCNCFRNAAIEQKSELENRKCDRAKYIYRGFDGVGFIVQWLDQSK